MIGRRHRFHGFNALRHVYARGQTVRGPLTSLKYLPSRRTGDAAYRAAVVVSRKVHKSAVVRNRIRRRIYEIIRRQAAEPGEALDIVIMAFSQQLASLPAAELERLIGEQLHKARQNLPAPAPRGGFPAGPPSPGGRAIVDRSKENGG